MSRFSESKVAERWLKRFSETDREIAASLIDEMLFVSGGELSNSVTKLFEKIRAEHENQGPLAFYAEREVEWDKNQILPIFPGTRVGRAVGKGPQPIPFNPDRPEVGSEGLIANLITSYCRANGKKTLNHPGPNLLRKRKAGPIIIVADFIGSGQRVWEMLEAFRAVASIRSWQSYHLIDFYVVAYSGTEQGLHLVRSSRLRPKILTVTGCPTIESAFRKPARDAVNRLCRTYPPGEKSPLGYGWAGALIAFEHGVPNNVPPILHRGWSKWAPLFQQRSTIAAKGEFPSTNREELAARAEQLLRIRDAETYLSDSRGRRWIKTMLVLAAIDVGARSRAQISAYSRLKLETVREIVDFTEIARWTTRKLTLSALGRSELRRLKQRRARNPVLPKSNKPFYYPTQLRAR
ncbi:hypothetical protein [Haematobacter sp.]|uniref:phosphoribosyltransferase-like protein n=1 Tax=Haematobacter sp. TaxID=2953762 RepID=UPI0028AC479B|nr:hypothetical protein [Haematobacter sp.]